MGSEFACGDGSSPIAIAAQTMYFNVPVFEGTKLPLFAPAERIVRPSERVEGKVKVVGHLVLCTFPWAPSYQTQEVDDPGGQGAVHLEVSEGDVVRETSSKGCFRGSHR